MSVLIKGMEIPICQTCPICDEKLYGNYCLITKEIVSFGFERGEKCPLIELPPHGRLIDADELHDKIIEYCSDGYAESADDVCEILDYVRDAPTILEAEDHE